MKHPAPLNSIQEYQEFTPTTAQYPEEMQEMHLCFNGFNEFAEIAKDVGKFARGDFDAAELDKRVKSEFGDIFWYLSQLANLQNFSLHNMLMGPILEIQFWRQDIPIHVDRAKLYTSNTFTAMYADLVDEATPLLMYAVSRDRLQKICTRLVKIFASVVCKDPARLNADHIFGALMEVLNKNRYKLLQRQADNTIKGDGEIRNSAIDAEIAEATRIEMEEKIRERIAKDVDSAMEKVVLAQERANATGIPVIIHAPKGQNVLIEPQTSENSSASGGAQSPAESPGLSSPHSQKNSSSSQPEPEA